MNQHSKSDFPPLPEDTIEGRKKKGKRREQTSYTPGASPSEQTLPWHVRPEDSPISPTPEPRATSTPATEPRTQSIPRRVFVTAPNSPSTLQRKFPRQERTLVGFKAKDYSLNFDEEEVEKPIRRWKE
ncbi:hypothetical protein O181_080580 [Austropuccinia psidii MF-1]|uniref:Uncharacterized protein n=1 Tax=Austropuccinia psidii MF-1 TaxID=1389203 RepID=A0A9Q3IJ13_9BASI|nr:hypothetical protein [Austropuccinia psidii MF-1]